MTSPSPADAASAAVPALTAEAAHARYVLDVAARGPESTRTIVPALMRSLLEQGYRTSVTWYLAPAPDDNLHEVIFSVRTAGKETPGNRRWRDRREIAAVLQEADHQAGNGDPVEVWAGNGHGLRRLVIASGPGRSPRFLLPHVSHYAGDPARAAAAVAAWRRLSAQWGAGPAPDPQGKSAGGGLRRTTRMSSRFRLPDPRRLAPPSSRPADGPPSAGLVPTGPQTEALTTALQEALGQVRVEVDLGAIEDLVADSLRSALAELPETALAPYAERLGTDGNPVAPPAGTSRGAGKSSRTPSTDLEISAPYGIPAVSADRPPPDEEGRQHPAAFPREDLERLVRSSVAAAVDATLADRLPELVRILASSTPAAAAPPRSRRPSPRSRLSTPSTWPAG